jgi:hypothetical protein
MVSPRAWVARSAAVGLLGLALGCAMPGAGPGGRPEAGAGVRAPARCAAGAGGAGGANDAGRDAAPPADLGGEGGSGGAGLTTFITRQGVQLMDGSKRYTFVGANFWQGMSLGADGAASGDPARLRRQLDRLQALGVTNVRMVASAEGPDSAPHRIVPSLMPMPGVYNEQVFKGLDLFLDELSRRAMRAVMVLNNYWEWTGGMGQYVSWSDGSQIPDRVSNSSLYNAFVKYVDRSAPPSGRGRAVWGVRPVLKHLSRQGIARCLACPDLPLEKLRAGRTPQPTRFRLPTFVAELRPR